MQEANSQPCADFSPDVTDTPADCALERRDERRYLVGGKLLQWNGPMSAPFRTVFRTPVLCGARVLGQAAVCHTTVTYS